MGAIDFFVCIILSLIIDVAINIISIVQFRGYLRFKRAEEVGLQLKYFDTQNSARVEVVVPYKFSKRRLNERKTEKEMLYMILTLCSISFFSRIFFLFLSFSYSFFFDFQNVLVFRVITNFIYSLVPTVSIFIFHSFSKAFRIEFKKIISFEKQNEMKCIFKCCYKY